MEKYTGEDATIPKENAVQKATEAVTHTDEAIESITHQLFQLYSTLLTEEARRPWNKNLGKQIDCTPWIDLFGVKHAKKRKRLWSSFMDCMTFHLQMVFQCEAANTQRFYISKGLKSPGF